MSQFRTFIVVGLCAGMSALGSVSSAEAASTSLQRANAASGMYMVTPAMMHAINIIVAEKMKMMRHRR